jgi:hypothetical protein
LLKTQCLGNEDDVDRLRIRLWTADTNGPIIHLPGNIWAWKLWWNNTDRGKILIGPSDFSGNHISSHPVAKRERLAKEMTNLALWNIFFHALKGSLTCRKISRHGADGFTSLRRKMCCGFSSPLKIHGHPLTGVIRWYF